MKEKLRITHRLIDKESRKLKGYQGIFIEGHRKGKGFMYNIPNIWLYAYEGKVENVIAYGDPIYPELDPFGAYSSPFPQSELNKMHLRGVNGFKLSSLPSKPYTLGAK